ncbi:hypothetical protein AEP_00373 [Curvibacter sp. AEP1-3]|nr:hypothetical protein AEP_00373 [Curvibacter sp. AEP1-3]
MLQSDNRLRRNPIAHESDFLYRLAKLKSRKYALDII